MTRKASLTRLALLLLALATIVVGTISLASAAVPAETRVGAINHAVEPLVGPPQHIAAGQDRFAPLQQPQIVVATGVAANSGGALVDAGKYDYLFGRVASAATTPLGRPRTLNSSLASACTTTPPEGRCCRTTSMT